MRWWWFGSEIDEDEEEPVSCYTIWWDTRERLKVIPRTLAAPFIKPDHDDIRTTADLIYQYGQALKHLPSLLRRLPFKTRTLEDELHEVRPPAAERGRRGPPPRLTALPPPPCRPSCGASCAKRSTALTS